MSTMSNPTPLKIDVTRYFRMADAGIFGDDGRGGRERVELIEGEILEMPPPNPAHSSAVSELYRLLVDAIPRSRAIVWCQGTVVLSRFTAPEPDLVVLPPHDHRFRERHPRPEDIWLAIEVAGTSLAYDRGRKAQLYAGSGIAEYWLLDVPGRALEIRRQPGADGYGLLRRAAAGELVAPAALPDCLLDWAQVFA
jgi:Uma2 family endonuclease